MNTMTCTKVAHCSQWRLRCRLSLTATLQPVWKLHPPRLYTPFFSRIESLSSKLDALTRLSAPLLFRLQTKHASFLSLSCPCCHTAAESQAL